VNVFIQEQTNKPTRLHNLFSKKKHNDFRLSVFV